ncbi:MAG TPA: peptidylprolyl isomerase [Pyrinomonadaceae bacterium]|nr:peptidylprolyl isomerase [Pyrinomonadaceae bacterium]
MSNLTKGLILVVVILAIGGGLVVWKKKVSGSGSMSFNQISREEMELLLSDVVKTNPMVLKRLKEDPEMKKQQLESLKQLLAFASQAKHDGLADDPSNKQELANIRAEVEAVNYDREINKDKGPMPAFGFISEDQVKGYWDNTQAAPSGGFLSKIGLGEPVETRSHEDEFNDFLNAKVGILKAQNPDMANREITDEEKTQARDIFAKTRLYKVEYETKAASGELAADFVKKTNLQVKLQQAQFLARLYSDKVADQLKVTDEEVDAYVKAHPEMDPETKKAQAQQILDRAKAGEDFAALANEFTQDPSNGGTDGQKKGGLYEGVRKGQMVPPFETAALALEAGQVAPELVQSDFGYHIIKLERKLGPSGKKDAKPLIDDKDAGKDKDKESGDTYDVRHILISTGIKDPDNPTAREQPVKDYARTKLEDEKQKAMIDKIVAENNVSVAEDFAIPEVTDEQIQQMRQNQRGPQMPQNMPPPGAPEGDKPGKPDAKKPDAKKK